MALPEPNPTNPVNHFLIRESVFDKSNEPLLHLGGDLDAESSPVLRDALHKHLSQGQVRVHLDLAGLTFISSSGLGVLINKIGEYRDADGDVLFHNIPTEIMDVFKMLEMVDFLSLG